LGIDRNYEPVSRFIACCLCWNCQMLPTQCRRTWQVTLITGSKRQSLLMAGDDELFMTWSLNITPKTTEQPFNCMQW